jgi:predicted DNA binding protein
VVRPHPPQRETLVRAVQGGYYSIPRRLSTQDLAGEFEVSDQAITEGLCRGIVTLVPRLEAERFDTDE